MSQLLTYIMESQVSQTQIIDLTGGDVAEIEEAGVPVLAQCNQNKLREKLAKHPKMRFRPDSSLPVGM